MLTEELGDLLRRLAVIAQTGPIPAVGHGDTTVGMTLLSALGIEYCSSRKTTYKGIVITARRQSGMREGTRVNLFAKVPNWELSDCKSSSEIVDRYGYETDDGAKKLYCTVRSRHQNTQNLMLKVDKKAGLLNEVLVKDKIASPVATWTLEELQKRLRKSHLATLWVTAKVIRRERKEWFHYRNAVYTSAPRLENLADLLDEGTVTVDHLIEKRGGKTNEKGPLFKIKPSNISMLFPAPQNFDLLQVEDLTSKK